MVEQIVPSIPDIVNQLFKSFEPWIRKGIVILASLGIIYLIYIITSLIMSIKRFNRLKRIEQKLDDIHKKLIKKSNKIN